MSLRETAYIEVREKILRGTLPFDRRTSEREIAEQYVEMSRTPVREAIAVLIAAGLLDQIPQVGVEVRRIDLRQAARAIRLRLGMETVMIDEIVGLEKPNLEKLHNSIAVMEAACEAEDQIEFMLADTRLHTELPRLGGFDTSVTGLQGLRDQIHLFRLECPLSPAEMSQVLGEHVAVVEAIETRQGAVANEAISSHLEATLLRLEEADSSNTPPAREARGRRQIETVGFHDSTAMQETAEGRLTH